MTLAMIYYEENEKRMHPLVELVWSERTRFDLVRP